MIKLTINRKDKASFCAYFKTVEDAKAFTDFELKLIENVKKKTLEAKA
jgi:hypothetical protein